MLMVLNMEPTELVRIELWKIIRKKGHLDVETI